MADENEATEIRRKRWGRRKGRPLNTGRSDALDKVLELYGIDVEYIINNKEIADLSKVSDEDISGREIRLEIGFGNGEHILARAEQNPDVLFIGCEPFINGIAALGAEILKRDIKNIRIWPDDAHFLIEKLPAASISRAYVLFPDPWPKARHVKRRFIRNETLDIFARILKPGAELRMATDVEDLAEWMLEQASEHQAFVQCEDSKADWMQMPADWVITRYQQKGFNAGRRSRYIFFRRK